MRVLRADVVHGRRRTAASRERADMSKELAGKKPSPLTVDGCDQTLLDQYDDEVCKHCGDHCTSSKECSEIENAHDDPA